MVAVITLVDRWVNLVLREVQGRTQGQELARIHVCVQCSWRWCCEDGGGAVLLARLGFQALCRLYLSSGCLLVSSPCCPMRSRHWPYPYLQILPWASALSCFRFWNGLPVVSVKRPQQSSMWCHLVTWEPASPPGPFSEPLGIWKFHFSQTVALWTGWVVPTLCSVICVCVSSSVVSESWWPHGL